MSKKTDTKKQQVRNQANANTLATAAGVSLDKSLSGLANAGLSIQKDLATIQERLVTSNAELKAVEESIELKRKEMEALHGADNILLSIDELRVKQAETVAELDREREAIKAQNDLLRNQLEVARQREEAEFQYALKLRRQAENDLWNENVRVRAREEQIRKEDLEKSWTAKSDELKSLDATYKAAIDKVATFDVEVKKAVDKEVAIVANAMKRDHEHATKIVTIENMAKVSGLEKDVAAKNAQLEAAREEIAELKAQLKASQDAQTQLAKDAVTSAANKQALADMQSLVTNVGGNGQRART